MEKPLPEFKMYPSKENPKKWIFEIPYYDSNGNPAVGYSELIAGDKFEVITSVSD